MIKENNRISQIFGENVFSHDVMKNYMSEETYAELIEVIESHKMLDLGLANKVAEAMKTWAMERGATHYCHWFQPLTGATAEKHDSFISIDKAGNTILEFTGKNLSKGEADASSFPSGGIRATFEARGYTVWDCSSPAFVRRVSENSSCVLYIPTAFCSYNGEALDKKTPLLRSMEALNREGMRVLNALGVDANRVIANVGGEQEYFLVDKNDFERRTDLRFTGRTLIGAPAIKGQEQNAQYYASITSRVGSFMSALNDELWKLGVTAKTQHNEAAPCQHELAPIFSSANIATDQNQLIMETMKRVAERFNLTCLLHEKPFNGVNGSGKHNNWSLCTDKGLNLLKPGKNPQENRLFLLFFTAVIAAVDEYSDLIRMSASNTGNEYRLGGAEAPPAIISIYIGDELEAVMQNILDGNNVAAATKHYINTGVNYLAELSRDTSDRNRTSPFAFTGNKFEFRMVGSSATLSNPNVMLNTVVAEMLSRIADRLESADGDLQPVVLSTIKELYAEHKRVIYKGNNYSKEWAREAKRRGLPIISSCVEAYDALAKEKNIALLEKHGVMTATELKSRHEIYLEIYNNTTSVEARTMLSMVNKELLDAVLRYQGELAKDLMRMRNVSPDLGASHEKKLFELEKLIAELDAKCIELKRAHTAAERATDIKKRAIIYRNQVVAAMREVRKTADEIEEIMPSSAMPYPTYSDILFYAD